MPNSNRILVELPGVKEPERVRKLLQGSASLEFWTTYNAGEIVPTLFIVFQTLQEKVKPLEFDPDPQWAVRAELEECKNEKEEE